MSKRITVIVGAGCLLVSSLFHVSGALAVDKGLVAHWNFDEGKGTVLHDRSGNKNHGKIHGAKWVKTKAGPALEFDGPDHYVDCGDNPNLRIAGDITIAAWVKLAAFPYPNHQTNWHIVDCEAYNGSGFMLRIDGATSKVTYRSSQKGTSQFAYSAKPLENNSYHHVVLVKKGDRVTYFIDAEPDITFRAKNPAPGTVSFKISTQGQSFHGLVDDLKIYNRAFSRDEAVREYKAGAKSRGKDASWFGNFRVTPYFYFHEGKVVIEVDFLGVLPLQKGEKVLLELGPSNQKPLEVRRVAAIPESAKDDYTLPIDKLSAGDYEIRLILKDGRGIKAQERIPFHYPPLPSVVPSPGKKVVPPLPPAREPVRYRFDLCEGGGFKIAANRSVCPFESSYSYPYGGENRLIASEKRDGNGEKSWKVQTRKISDREYTVTARGKYYTIERRVLVQPTRVYVKDTIKNNSDEDVGIIIHNRLNAKQKDFTDSYLSGWKGQGRRKQTYSPSVFVARQGLGIGLVPLDDVYIVQSAVFYEKGMAGIATEEFALAKGASYTLEWAVYPNETGDYYDFINVVRKDEDRIGTIDGGFAFISKGPFSRRNIPTKKFVALRSIKYGCIHCLSGAADDPQVSIEGIEFMDFPKEMALLKKQIAAIHKKHPNLKVMFHVAHSLYATNRPNETFPDSRVVDKDGKQVLYGTEAHYWDSYAYLSKARVRDGWRFWIYYPTPGNSFHDALMKSVDVMMDEIGCDGVFMDGFMYGYGSRYTYDRWDGHTAEIDPKTKTIKRKVGSVLLLSQPSLVQFARKIRDKGGVVVANNSVLTRTIAGEKYIVHDWEVSSGPYLHLAPNAAALANLRSARAERDVHKDVLDKLKWGMAFFYYQEGNITYESLPAQMFPITFEEIRSGLIKGKERLVTMHSGVYGWHGDQNLHFAYHYDARGARASHNFLSTVDHRGVRTEITLEPKESAVLKKIPVSIQSSTSVNLVAQQYDTAATQLVLNGKGKVRVRIRDGDFRIEPHASYLVKAHTMKHVRADKKGTLSFRTGLDGQMRIRIEPASSP